MEFCVLMSVYYKENPQNFKRALESNLALQTLKPNQFVLVCDGPLTAELDEVIKDYGVKYPEILNVFRLEKNEGLGNALNYGLGKCNFDLVIRSDSDDICLPERFALQVDFMEKNPEISASSGTIDEFEDDPNHPKRIKTMPLTHEELCRYAKKRCPLNHMAVIFRKSDVIEVGSYRHLQYLEDYYLWVRLIAAGKRISNIDKLLVHACVGDGMLKRRGDKRYIKSWKVLGEYMKKHKMLSSLQHSINITKLSVWCAIPDNMRMWLYKNILRK